MQTKIIIDKNEGETNVFVKPEVQRELARFGLARTDDKPRGEAEFTQTIPRREGRRRSQNEGEATVVNPLPRCCHQRWRMRESAGGTEYIKKEEHEKDNNPRVYGMAHHTIIRPDRPAMDS